MRLPEPIRRSLVRWALWYSERRPPDNPIGGDYLHRWYITPWSGWYRDVEHHTRWQRFVHCLPGIYLHFFYRSDYDRALHDHPWPSVSLILTNGYYEHTPTEPDVEHSPTHAVWRPPGAITWRGAQSLHRVELAPGTRRVITLFLTGRRRRMWGFACEEGWRPYPEWERRGGCD